MNADETQPGTPVSKRRSSDAMRAVRAEVINEQDWFAERYASAYADYLRSGLQVDRERADEFLERLVLYGHSLR